MDELHDWVLTLELNGVSGLAVSRFRYEIEQNDIISASICRKISGKNIEANNSAEMKPKVAALLHLQSIIPKTYGDAVRKYSWIKCESHEWDNRTALENIEYILIEAQSVNYPRINPWAWIVKFNARVD